MTGCLAALHLSRRSRTSVFLSTSDTVRLGHAPFIYLLTALIRDVWPSMSAEQGLSDNTVCFSLLRGEMLYFKQENYFMFLHVFSKHLF